MNFLYKLANLLDGDFDGRVIHFSRKRYLANLFIEYTTYSFFVCHLIVFFRPDLKYDIGEYPVSGQSRFGGAAKIHG